MTRDAKLDLAFARALRELRAETDSTLAEVARDSGVCPLTASNYHKRAPDCVHKLAMVLGYYGESLADFWARVQEYYDR